MLSFKNVNFIYEPYPIGVASDVFEKSFYGELVKTFPPQELFSFMAYHGNKYSLSEVNNPEAYHQYVRSSPPWFGFYKWIKRPEFPGEILEMLCDQNIDLDLQNSGANSAASSRTLMEKLRLRPARNTSNISARFEFSMLPADGGFIKPHTDSPQKIITLVVGILNDGEWNPAFGGGTEVLRPKDSTDNFNYKNRYLEFDDVETLDKFEYTPNNCTIFIKTFNSLHAVRPMLARGSDLMRKTLTINIERVL